MVAGREGAGRAPVDFADRRLVHRGQHGPHPDSARSPRLPVERRPGRAHRNRTAVRDDRVRLIRPEDDPVVQRVLIEVLTEFGATGAGFSDQDEELGAMSAAYGAPDAAYFVAELDGGIVGGAGIGPLPGVEPNTCELRKMYLLPAARGHGLGRRLLETCLDEARRLGYRECYLETLAQMDRARDLYVRFGFHPLEAPMGDTGHFGCNRWYALSL
ncbi:MAG: GNAT family N-acetyltransferase [Gemmatimonadetes bacterium]|nr:GNAT family N-acetyltransferase [Gemmatimonadota bacterium]